MSTFNLKSILISRLENLPDVTVSFWKDTDLLCVFYQEKEIAHFQNDYEIDIRLIPKIIKQNRLKPPERSLSHPNRSKNSRWLIQAFFDENDLDHIIKLIETACTLR